MVDFKLSPHFTFYELTRTVRVPLLAANRQEGLAVVPKLALLCATLLEPLRGVVGAPVTISNGYRSDVLNRAVGGAANSQHRLGEAADWWPGDARRDRGAMWSGYQACAAYLRQQGVMFGQFIFEEKADAAGPYYWYHLSLGAPLRTLGRCGELMTYKEGAGYALLERVDVSGWA